MTERFDDDELERYGRQIVLPEVGGTGQERLRRARVAVIGAGGLGSPAALYLGAAGVGSLTLVDDDRVALGNLHRQVLFSTEDVGRAKVEAAAASLRRRSPRLDVRTIDGRLTAANADTWLAGHDLVVDGSDSFETRRIVADAAAGLGVPLISGAVQGFEGQLTLFAPFADPTAPCFHCLFPDAPRADALPTCAAGGVLGPVAGQLGTMMATEAIKLLIGVGPSLSGTLLLVDGLAARIDPVHLRRRRSCGDACPLRHGISGGVARDSALATRERAD